MAAPPRWLLYLGGGLLLAGGYAAYRKRRQLMAGASDLTQTALNLVRSAYANVDAWAADRGAQIRRLLGIATPGSDALRPEGSVGPQGISTDEWNRRKVATLATVAQPKFTAFMAEAQAVARRNGAELMIWDASRSLERQLSLYKQGRTTPGTQVTKIIHSNHLPGLAVDLIFRAPSGGVLFEWPAGTKKYPRWYFNEVLPLAKKHGLQSLYLARGLDAPHVEMVEGVGPAVAALLKQVKEDFPGLA